MARECARARWGRHLWGRIKITHRDEQGNPDEAMKSCRRCKQTEILVRASLGTWTSKNVIESLISQAGESASSDINPETGSFGPKDAV